MTAHDVSRQNIYIVKRNICNNLDSSISHLSSFFSHLISFHQQSPSLSQLIFLSPVSSPDNTASILTKRGGFHRREQPLYRLPVLIVDSGSPSLSSTNTLSIRVCECDADGAPQACGTEAFLLTAGLSTGALTAILACIMTLLGENPSSSPPPSLLRSLA